MLSRRAVASLLLVAALASCGKREAAAPPPATPAFGAAASAPRFLEHVPANTPYVFAGLEPIPRGYWQKLGATFGPDLDPLIDKALAEPATTADERFMHALARELRGNVNEAGFKRLFGVDASARWVIYGLGVVPVVRVELADPKALPATLERIAKAAESPLGTRSHEGRPYWRTDAPDVSGILAVADGQLVMTLGPPALVDRALGHVLGLDKPKPNMTAGPLAAIIRDNQYGPWAGYVDSVRLVETIIAEKYFQPPDAQPPSTCAPALAVTAALFPRLTFGYDEWSERRITGRAVLELSPPLAARLAGLTVAVPGLSAGPLPGRPLFAFGAGVDLDAGRKLAGDFFGGVSRLSTACGAGADAERELSQVVALLAQPLPPPLAQARGLVVSVLRVDLEPGRAPAVEGYAILAASEPPALLDKLTTLIPLPALSTLPRDGAWHEIASAQQAGGIGPVRAALKPSALVATVGGQPAADAVERALAAPAGKSPLFAISYDYPRLMDLILSTVPQPSDQPVALVRRIVGLVGVVSMWATPTERGLLFGMTMDPG